MPSDKKEALAVVSQKAEAHFNAVEVAEYSRMVRDEKIRAASEAGATQQEIADACTTTLNHSNESPDPVIRKVSRQRIQQVLEFK